MITRDQALGLIREHITQENIVKHMIAVESLMARTYDELKTRGKTDIELGGTKDQWAMAGLLHDGDYCEGVPDNQQGIQIIAWAKEKGYDIPDNVAHATAAHNWSNTGVKPESLMDWTIFCGDSLTGLIVASALVLPSKSLADVTAQTVLKRFKEKSFARGTRREEIAMCEEHLGLSLEEFVTLSLQAMQEHHEEIGL